MRLADGAGVNVRELTFYACTLGDAVFLFCLLQHTATVPFMTFFTHIRKIPVNIALLSAPCRRGNLALTALCTKNVPTLNKTGERRRIFKRPRKALCKRKKFFFCTVQKAKIATRLLETRPKMCIKSAYVFKNTLQFFVGSSRRDRRCEKGRKKTPLFAAYFFVTACFPTDPRSPAKAVPAFWERFSWLPLRQGVQPRQARLFSLLPEQQFPDGFCPDGGKL